LQWQEVVDDFNVAPTLHYRESGVTSEDRSGQYKDNDQKPTSDWKELFYSAYTVAELGEMLPKQVQGFLTEVVYLQQVMAGQFIVFYGAENGVAYIVGDEQISEGDTNEANARAKMLIYLIENNLITL